MRHQVIDKINQDRKAQKQNNTQGKGASHQKQVFLCGHSMMNPQRRFNPEKAYMDGVVTRFYRFGISRNRCNGRHLCSVFGWGPRRQQDSNHAHQNTTDNSNAADTKQRNVGKFFSDKESQGSA